MQEVGQISMYFVKFNGEVMHATESCNINKKITKLSPFETKCVSACMYGAVFVHCLLFQF